ncbi:TetR/AcrR family transcriptional regulator [Nonomuraea sp. 3N208]|uniref:TetR/AcrR family transcriptional regulator n=1 Tax=Nonomuraea sp. 3N208 TaxID=3457421 RepID=UPI003FD24561
MRNSPKRGRYHHGELREAVLDTAVDLITEKGVAGFSLAEASRRLGVTVAAPYRHFADRDEVLAALAMRAVDGLAAALKTEAGQTAATPADALAAAARGFIRFAAEHRSLYLVLLASGLDKSRHPELLAATQRIGAPFLEPALALCDGDPDSAQRLTTAAVAVAQGYAAMLLDNSFQRDDVASVAAQASDTILALVRGRVAP